MEKIGLYELNVADSVDKDWEKSFGGFIGK